MIPYTFGPFYKKLLYHIIKMALLTLKKCSDLFVEGEATERADQTRHFWQTRPTARWLCTGQSHKSNFNSIKILCLHTMYIYMYMYMYLKAGHPCVPCHNYTLKVPSNGSRTIAHLPISLYYRVLSVCLVLSLANLLCCSMRSLGLNERK